MDPWVKVILSRQSLLGFPWIWTYDLTDKVEWVPLCNSAVMKTLTLTNKLFISNKIRKFSISKKEARQSKITNGKKLGENGITTGGGEEWAGDGERGRKGLNEGKKKENILQKVDQTIQDKVQGKEARGQQSKKRN